MSAQENKQFIQKMLADFAEGKADTFLNAISDDIVFEIPTVPAKHFTLESTYRGREHVLELLGALDELSEVLAFQPYDFIAEGDKVIVLLNEKSRAKPTNREFGQDFVQLWTLRDGKIIHCKMWEDTYAIWAAYKE